MRLKGDYNLPNTIYLFLWAPFYQFLHYVQGIFKIDFLPWSDIVLQDLLSDRENALKLAFFQIIQVYQQLNCFQDINAARLGLVFDYWSKFATFTELFNESFADLEKNCYEFQGHGSYSFFLLVVQKKV